MLESIGLQLLVWSGYLMWGRAKRWWLSRVHTNVMDHVDISKPRFYAVGSVRGIVSVRFSITNHSFTELEVCKIEGVVAQGGNAPIGSLSMSLIQYEPQNRRLGRHKSDNQMTVQAAMAPDEMFWAQAFDPPIIVKDGWVTVQGSFGTIALPIPSKDFPIASYCAVTRYLLPEMQARLRRVIEPDGNTQ